LSTRRRKALWAGKAASVDALVVEAVLVPRRRCRASARRVRRGATGSVRGLFRRSRSRSKTPRRMTATPPMGRPAAAPSGVRPQRTEGPKSGERRQAHTSPGLDCRKVVWRRLLRSRRWVSACFVRGGRSARRKSRGSEILRSVGCSFREVGCRSRREASSEQRQGEPRGKPRGRAVARRGSSVPDEGSFIAPGERVRGRVKRTSKGARPELHPTARLDIEPTEGTLIFGLLSFLTRRRRARVWCGWASFAS
jgi:hypothetical protein